MGYVDDTQAQEQEQAQQAAEQTAPVDNSVQTPPASEVKAPEQVTIVEEKPIETPPEKSEAEKAEEAFKARIDLLKGDVRKLVDDLLHLDYTIEELGYALDIFKNVIQLRTAATKEHEELVKTCTEANEKFGSFKAKDLTYLDEKATATTQA